jgi:hypothetical protein
MKGLRGRFSKEGALLTERADEALGYLETGCSILCDMLVFFGV